MGIRCSLTCWGWLCGTREGGKFGRARWLYFGLFTLCATFAWVARDFDALARVLGRLRSGCEEHSRCEEKEAVLRVSLGSFVFFVCHALATVGVDSTSHPRAKLHTSYWWFHILLLVVLEVVAFLLPTGIMHAYFELARVLAGGFLVVQLLTFLDAVYTWNDELLSREGPCTFAGAAVACAFMYLCTFAALGVLYWKWAPEATCSVNIFLITLTFLLAIIYSAVSLYGKVNAGVLTSGLVFGYTTLLLWSALQSLPPTATCALSNTHAQNSIPTKVVMFLVALGAALVSTVRSGGNTSAFEVYSADETVPYRCDFFHAIFALGSAYIAMLFTGWSLEGTIGQYELEGGWVSFGVKLTSQYVVVVLYVWSMVAPLVCKNRSFT